MGADRLLRGKGKCLVEVDVLRFVMRRGGVGDVRCKQAEALRTQRQRLSMHPEQTIFQRQCGLPLKLSPSLPFLSFQAIRLVCRPEPTKGHAHVLTAVYSRAPSLAYIGKASG